MSIRVPSRLKGVLIYSASIFTDRLVRLDSMVFNLVSQSVNRKID